MKYLNKIFPLLFLSLTGCNSLFGPKTDLIVRFHLEIASKDVDAEIIKEVLFSRLVSNGFYKENIKIEKSENILSLSIENYDSTFFPLSELRKLLTSSGQLEFWETYDNADVVSYLFKADSCLAAILPDAEKRGGNPSDIKKDTSSIIKVHASTETSAVEKWRIEHPLFFVLSPSIDQEGKVILGPVIGRSLIKDTAQVMSYLHRAEVKNILPPNMRFGWHAEPSLPTIMSLISLKCTSRDGKAAMHGNIISNAVVDYSSNNGPPSISLSMEGEAAAKWAELTGDNLGRSIAIVLDNIVFSYPTVQGKITGGASQITGNFTVKEAQSIASMLKAGILPNSIKIVSEERIEKK